MVYLRIAAMVCLALILLMASKTCQIVQTASETTAVLRGSSDGGDQRLNYDQYKYYWQYPNAPAEIRKGRYIECEGHNVKVSKTGGFCIGRKGVRYAGADEGVAAAMCQDFIRGGTAADLGAGLGHYQKAFETACSPQHKPSFMVSFDGAINVETASDGFVKHMDLTQPAASDQRPCAPLVDWVVSIEVAEHIPQEFEQAYLRNIACRASKGAIVSWALPTQGGLSHVNCKTQEQATEAFRKWGLEYDEAASVGLRQNVARLPWLRNTLSVYRVVTQKS